MILVCQICGEAFDDEDSCNCPNCGSFCVRKEENE